MPIQWVSDSEIQQGGFSACLVAVTTGTGAPTAAPVESVFNAITLPMAFPDFSDEGSHTCEIVGDCMQSTNYINNEFCQFVIGQAGKLTFEALDTEQCCDKLDIVGGSSQYAGQIDNLQISQSVYVKAGTEVVWTSDSSVNGANMQSMAGGWRVCFDGDDINELEAVGGTLFDNGNGNGNGEDYGGEHYNGGEDYYGGEHNNGGGNGGEHSNAEPGIIKNVVIMHSDTAMAAADDPFAVGNTIKVEWETEDIQVCSNIYNCNSYLDMYLMPYESEVSLEVPERPHAPNQSPEQVCSMAGLEDTCTCAELPDCGSAVDGGWQGPLVSQFCTIKCAMSNGITSPQYEWVPNVGSFTFQLYGGWEGNWVIKMSQWDVNTGQEIYGHSAVFELEGESFTFVDPYAEMMEAAQANQADEISCMTEYGTDSPLKTDYLEEGSANNGCVEVELNVQMMAWPDEHSIKFACFETQTNWQFSYEDENQLRSRTYCLKPGKNYQLLAQDSYGDGWNMGSYTLTNKVQGSLFFTENSAGEAMEPTISPLNMDNYSPSFAIETASACPYFSCEACVAGNGCGWCVAKGSSTCVEGDDCGNDEEGGAVPFLTHLAGTNAGDAECSANMAMYFNNFLMPLDASGNAITEVSSGDKIKIKWSAANVADTLNVRLEFHVGDGSAEEKVATIGMMQHSVGAAGYEYTVPAGIARASTYKIKIFLLVDETVKKKSPNFTVKPQCLDVKLRIWTEEYPEEIFWQIPDSSNRVGFVTTTTQNSHLPTGADDDLGVSAYQYSSAALQVYSLCMDPGDYTFLAHDSYGDGWHSGGFTIQDDTPGNLRYYVGSESSKMSVQGSLEAFQFSVSSNSAEDCTAPWRQSCSECVSTACGWCESTALCRNSAGSCPLTTVVEGGDDIPNWITGTTDNCLSPSFNTVTVTNTATGQTLAENAVVPVGQEVKVSWTTTAIASCANTPTGLMNCQSWIEIQLINVDDAGYEEGMAWENIAMYESSANIGEFTFSLSNAWAAEGWKVKLVFWDMSGGGEAIEGSSIDFEMGFVYDECTTATNEIFTSPQATTAWSTSSWQCESSMWEDLPPSCDAVNQEECCGYHEEGNIPSYNLCACSWSIGDNMPGMGNGKSLFETYLVSCSEEIFFYEFDAETWEAGGEDWTPPVIETASLQQSTLPDCEAPSDACRSMEVIAEIFDWPEESTWELTSESCLLAMAGPWTTDDKDTQQITTVCVDEGTWTLTGYDTFGDGWNAGGKMKVIEEGNFIVVPTAVEGSSTSKDFVISNQACSHSDCNSCLGESGCGYCVDNPARASCMPTTSSGCEQMIQEGQGQCAAATVNMLLPDPENTAPFKSGKNTTTITWETQNIGGSLPMELLLVTDTYPCVYGSDDDCSASEMKHHEYVITDSTPNTGSFVWEIPGTVPTHDDWTIKISNSNVNEFDSLGPFKFTASCVDVVIVTEAVDWAMEMEWSLYSEFNNDMAILAATSDKFTNGKKTIMKNSGSDYFCDWRDECEALENEPLCLLPGNYLINAIDTYGDGWNGGGNVRVMTGDTRAPLGTPLYPEGQGGVLHFTVEPLEDVDTAASQCLYAMSCGACENLDGCGWCVNSGKCQASVGTCTGLFVWDTACPTNIQVLPLEDNAGDEKLEYAVNDPIKAKWQGTGFTADSAVTVSVWKGNVELCDLDNWDLKQNDEGNNLYDNEYAAFEKCTTIEYLFDLSTEGRMQQGATGLPGATLEFTRFVNDNDYFLVVASNVEEGVFGFGNVFEVTNPDSGLCTKENPHVQLTHANFLVPGEEDTTYGERLEFFVTDGSASADYENHMECEWSFSAPPGYNVYMSFLDVSLEQGCFDRITLRDGSDSEAPIQSYICSGNSNPMGEVVAAPGIKSTGPDMWVRFQTDDFITSGGFQAVVTAVLDMSEPDSDEEVEEEDNAGEEEEEVIFRPSACSGHVEFTPAESAMGNVYSGYAGLIDEYTTDLECSWKFNARLGYIMEIEFTEFKLETDSNCEYDYVTITDVGTGGQDSCGTNGIASVKYCGSILPSAFESCTNEVEVVFSSDDSVVAKGFGIKYKSVENLVMPSRRLLNVMPGKERGILQRRMQEIEEEESADVSEHCQRTEYVNAKMSEGNRISGTISDGEASSYKKGENQVAETICEWLIEVDEGFGIKLEFESFHVEGGEVPIPCAYDKLKIYSGEEKSEDAKLASLCGRKNWEDGYIYPTCSESNKCVVNVMTGALPSTVFTRSNKMLLQFDTDNSVEFSGFVANFKATQLDAIESETFTWHYEEWGDCLPNMYGSSIGTKTRTVRCGPDGKAHIGAYPAKDTVGPSAYEEDAACPMGGSKVKNPAYDLSLPASSENLEFLWEGTPEVAQTCSVDSSSILWAGHYSVHNELCVPEDFCCFQGDFNVVQKNADQKDGIFISDLFSDGPLSNRKCQFADGDSIDASGELIYFPLNVIGGDASANKGTFTVFGTEFESTKDTGFIEFTGEDNGISLGQCIGGDCMPKTINCVVVAVFVGIEVILIAILLVMNHVYRGISSHQAKKKAMKAAKKNESGTANLNDLVEKRMNRQMTLKKSSNSIRMSSGDNAEVLQDADFHNFEGFDLCGMQKLDRIDMRDPQDRRILQAFKKADIDDSGFIDVDELLRALIETTGKPWTKTQAQAMLDEFDDDGSGELGVEEFKMLVNSTIGGMLNVNRNKYSTEDMNSPWEAPDIEVAREFGKSHLAKVPDGEGAALWAKEPCIPRMLFGDKDEKLMPVWSTNLDNCDFGLGISLYFKNLQSLSFILWSAGMVALPMILSNGMSQPSSMDLVLKGSYVSSESLSFCAGITDLVICGLLGLVLMLADSREKKLVAAIDAGIQTPGDYTIVVKSPPPSQEISVGTWRKHFEDLTKGMKRVKDDYVEGDQPYVNDGDIEDGKVVSITFCVKGVRAIYGLVEKRRELEEKLFKMVRTMKKKDPEYKLPHASKDDPPSGLGGLMGVGVGPAYLMSQLDDLDKKIDALQTIKTPLVGSRMFITFDSEMAMEEAILKGDGKKGPGGE